jgi:hypothetical protein
MISRRKRRKKKRLKPISPATSILDPRREVRVVEEVSLVGREEGCGFGESA